MKKLVSTVFFLWLGITAWSQSNLDSLLREADTFLDPPNIKVLLLGVFHFSNPGLDGHKTKSRYKVDILNGQRQKEVKELAEMLARFQPTRIAVESRSQVRMDSLYREYLSSGLKNHSDETVQIGFRLAKSLGLDGVYAVDAPLPDIAVTDAQLQAFEQDFDHHVQRWEDTYGQYMDFKDSLKTKMPLKDYLLFINSAAMHQYEHGQYLLYTGVGTKDQPVGADVWLPRWFNRNVRIFANIQRIASNGDRVLVIFGNGHMHILRDLFATCRTFELAQLEDYLR